MMELTRKCVSSRESLTAPVRADGESFEWFSAD